MVAAISPDNTSVQKPQFKGRTKIKSVEQYPDYKVVTMETEASTGKKWGVGIASAAVCGLGQAINGEWGKAAGFFVAGNFIPPVIAAVAGGIVGLKGGKIGSLGGPMAMLGLLASIVVPRVWSIVDAVKNASTETTQIIPNKNDNATKINVNA